MNREAELLLNNACNSLLLSIEFFNRPHDMGRANTVLILLDHSFEMLLKASLLHKGGNIHEQPTNQTIGFETCVGRALSDGEIKFLNDEQAIVLRSINALRDAAQHHLLNISENQLYMHTQSGLTLFRTILKEVFQQDLADLMPERVLPVSILPPTDLSTFFDNEISEVIKLIQTEAIEQIDIHARLKPLIILDSAIKGEDGQPSPEALDKAGKELLSGKKWQDIFQGVTALEIIGSETGPGLSLFFTKKDGPGFHVVPEGTPGAKVIAIKRVDELGFYNMSLNQIAEKVGLTPPKALAMVRYLKLTENPEYYKIFQMGKVQFKRYSQKVIPIIQETISKVSMDEIWITYGTRRQKSNANQ